MSSIDEQILRATKEVIVKFIEVGRLSPTGFHETFKSTYRTIKEAVGDLEEKPQEQGKKKK
jgi:hypothetical protein